MIIFDFDGVLFDSLDEVAVTAFNTVTGRLATTLEELPPVPAALFKRNRFHFQAIGDAVPLMKWCLGQNEDNPDRILSPSEYLEILQAEIIPLFHRTRNFFTIRRKFLQKDRRRWLALNKPYQPLWDIVVRRDGKPPVILTHKNREAVMELCAHFGLALPAHAVYSGDDGATKIENLGAIHQKYQKDAYIFIDDSIKNLRQLSRHFSKSNPRLELVLANWGYIGPDSRNLAEMDGFAVFSQADLVDVMDNRRRVFNVKVS
jgi:phosphoglycolate phosphatase-like HAD superfamily hydrolase